MPEPFLPSVELATQLRIFQQLCLEFVHLHSFSYLGAWVPLLVTLVVLVLFSSLYLLSRLKIVTLSFLSFLVTLAPFFCPTP